MKSWQSSDSSKQTYFHILADTDSVCFGHLASGLPLLSSTLKPVRIFVSQRRFGGGCLKLLLSSPCKGLHTSPGKWPTPIEASCVPWRMLLRWRSKTFRVLVFSRWHINVAVHLYSMLASWVFAAFWLWTAEVWLTAVVRVYLPHVVTVHGTFSKGIWRVCWPVL